MIVCVCYIVGVLFVSSVFVVSGVSYFYVETSLTGFLKVTGFQMLKINLMSLFQTHLISKKVKLNLYL